MKYILFIFFILFNYNSFANISIPDDLDVYISSKFYILKDNKENINDVIKSENWLILDEKIPNFGYFDDYIWIKTKIKNNLVDENNFILNIELTTIDYIDAYLILNNEISDMQLLGDLRNFNTRRIKERTPQIPFNLYFQEEIEIYLKIETKGSLQLPIKIKTMVNSIVSTSTSSLYHGLFFGLIFILIVYNLFLFFSFKEYSYLFYVIFASLTLIFQIIEYGFASQYIWPETPIINSFILPFLSPIILVSMCFFFLHTLNLYKLKNTEYYITLILILFNIILFFLSFIIDYNLVCKIITYSSIITNFFFILLMARHFKKGDYFIKLSLISLLSFALGLLMFTFGKIGFTSYDFFTENGLKIGQSLEIFFLSIALSFKLNKIVYEVSHDKLTGAVNRLGFDINLSDVFEKCNFNNSPLNLIMIDVDKFKNINDNYGHVIGDKVLTHISQSIKEIIKKYNTTLFRYGGEEFSIILPYITSHTAQEIAEEIRSEIESSPFLDKNIKLSLTISLGCGSYQFNNGDYHYEDLIKFTDKLLYKAKNQGRNKVCFGDFIEYFENKV